MLRHVALWLLILVPLPRTAIAQIQNGDFELGGQGWTRSIGVNWTVTFPPTGGNPNGHCQIESPGSFSAGSSVIFQTFECGPSAEGHSCVIRFDYRLIQFHGGPNTGRIKVLVDGQHQFTSDPKAVGFTPGTITVPCGPHSITLSLEVDPLHNRWQGSFDNVRAECDIATPIEHGTWGEIKRQFYAE